MRLERLTRTSATMRDLAYAGWKWGAYATAGVALGTASLLWLGRRSVRGLEAHPDPATDYADAVERLARLQQADDERVNPVCRSRGLLHGRKTEKAVILIHGITNCPQQFEPLGQRFFGRGYNVLLPRMPRHGYRDRMTDDLKNLRAEELRDFGDQIVDLGAGLGERLTIVGLSAGATLAAWAAQHRPELSQSVLIAPAIGMGTSGFRLQLLLLQVLGRLPNVATQRFYKFGDAAPYAYLGFSSRSLGETMRLGLATISAAIKQKPASRRVLVITNAADTAVSNNVTRQFMMAWQMRGLREIEMYEFERELKLHHDLIDPHNPIQQVDLVYPILLDLIDRP
jgi:carboxylesterase